MLCFLWCRVVCCRAGLLVVPVGGGPAASRPRCELRSARRLEARPGPATAHGHRSQALRSLRRPPHRRRLACWCVSWCVVSKPVQAPAQRHRSVTRCPQASCPALACRIAEPTTNFACNSPATLSNHEFTVLELQHFQTLLKLHPIELHAEFGEFPFPWLSLCLRGIALHRWAMHRLVASVLLCYLVHWCCI